MSGRSIDDQRLSAAIKGDLALRRELLAELGALGVEEALHERLRDAKGYRVWLQASMASGEITPATQAGKLRMQASFVSRVHEWLDEVHPQARAQHRRSFRDRMVAEVLAAVAEVLETEHEMEIARVELDRLMQPDAHATSAHRGTAQRRHVPRGDAL